MKNNERRRTYNNFISGKPEQSGNYVVKFDGYIYTDDYTVSGGGHWWNVGLNGGRDGVLYDPDSYQPLGN